jgi:hypothetical protein
MDRDLYWAIPFAAPAVLAVVGKRFAGVGTAIEYLHIRHGFSAYTLGGELRTIAEERGVPVEYRRYLQDLGDEVRTETADAGYLARCVLRRVRSDYLRRPAWSLPRGIVIGGLKTCGELEVISAMRNFHCLEIRMEDDDLRFRRVLERGVLEEEYEAERKRREAGEGVEAGGMRHWEELDDEKRRAYFSQLDKIHNDGHPGSWPERFRGRPAQVIAKLEDPLAVKNDSDSMGSLHAEVDKVLRVIRPRQRIVHH